MAKTLVTPKLNSEERKACRKAFKMAGRVVDALTLQLVFQLAARFKNEPPKNNLGDKKTAYTHGIVFPSQFDKAVERAGLSIWTSAQKSTHKGENDLDRLLVIMADVWLIARKGKGWVWAGLKEPQIVHESKQNDEQWGVVSALYSDDSDNETATAPRKKRKAKRCPECEMVLAKCICEYEDDDPDDDDDDE